LPEGLRAAIAPPDLAIRARVEQVRQRLARAKALWDSLQLQSASAEAEAAATDSDRLGYRPLQAEAFERVASTRMAQAHYAEAETAYKRAYHAAQASQYKELLVRVATGLAWWGYYVGKTADARFWTDGARAALEALG